MFLSVEILQTMLSGMPVQLITIILDSLKSSSMPQPHASTNLNVSPARLGWSLPLEA
jgi:hypothetical protein